MATMNNTTWTLSTGSPSNNPATVRTAQIKSGHVGQVWVAGKIAWESKPYAKAIKAQRKATAHRDTRLAEVFA